MAIIKADKILNVQPDASGDKIDIELEGYTLPVCPPCPPTGPVTVVSSVGDWEIKTGTFPEMALMGRGTTVLPSGKILLVGGAQYTPLIYSDLCHTYDLVTDTYERVADLPVGLYNVEAQLLDDGRILLFGGTSIATGTVSSSFIYDPVLGKVSDTGPIPFVTHAHATVKLADGSIMSFGGNGDNVARFDPATDTWTAKNPMVYSAYYASCELRADGKVQLCGGKNNAAQYLSHNYIYDPATDTYTAAANLPHPMRGGFFVRLADDNLMYGCGEFSNSSGSGVAYVYDVVKDKWTWCEYMPEIRLFTDAVNINGDIFVMSGNVADQSTHNKTVMVRSV